MPVTSSEFVYYGGFHIFSSAVFATTSSGAPPGIASTWLYYGGFHSFLNTTVAPVSTSSGPSGGIASTWQYFGGFHVFSNTPLSVGSTWQYYGGFHIFADGSVAAATSSGAATVARRLISPTGFKTAPTVVRF
jgi:hypothetical protein